MIARVAVAFDGLLAARGGVDGFAANTRHKLIDQGVAGRDRLERPRLDLVRWRRLRSRRRRQHRQVRDQLEASGFTPGELDHFLGVLDAPGTLVGSPVLI